jgi:hypothetical protein
MMATYFNQLHFTIIFVLIKLKLSDDSLTRRLIYSKSQSTVPQMNMMKTSARNHSEIYSCGGFALKLL